MTPFEHVDGHGAGVLEEGCASLSSVSQPSMVGVFESVVGDWGEVFISVAVIVSVLGAYLAWTLMAAEVMFIPARADDFPACSTMRHPRRSCSPRSEPSRW